MTDDEPGPGIECRTFQKGPHNHSQSAARTVHRRTNGSFPSTSSTYSRLFVLRNFSLLCAIAICTLEQCVAFPVFSSHHLGPSFRQNLIKRNIAASPTNTSAEAGLSGIAPALSRPMLENRVAFHGFKLIGDSHKVVGDEQSYHVKESSEIEVQLFASEVSSSTPVWIGLTNAAPSDEHCSVRTSTIIQAEYKDKYSLIIKIYLTADPEGLPYFFCYSLTDPFKRDGNGPIGTKFEYMFNDAANWRELHVMGKGLPIYIQLFFIILLLSLSGLFSGLNLGLMALDLNELQVIQRCGTSDEKKYASTIEPLRQKGNLLLCTLLLGNVLVNNTLTIFLDQLTSGFVAVLIATLAIVVFGEIVPQASCSRHGLFIGARTIYITYLFMALTYPLSYPISLILDRVLGEEIGNVYNRERLMEYIRVTKDHNNFEPDEMNLISGALKFKNIRVVDVMTILSDVFMLPYHSVLDYETMAKINNSGYSRIPIYEGEISNVVAMLHVKDLALIDAKQEMRLETVLKFYQHPLISVFEDVTLQYMLAEFKKGKSHMALVRRVVDNGINDPTYELLGVVTLEDVIEELIQAEINDETDIVTDNRRKQKRVNPSRQNNLDFIRFNAQDHVRVLTPSPQILLATYQFLVSTAEPFRPEHVSEEVMKLLLHQDIYFRAEGDPSQTNLNNLKPESVLYRAGVESTDFIMILEGRARVVCTNEGHEYEAGPFCFFGKSALMDKTELRNITERRNNNNLSEPSETNKPKLGFIPDFTVYCTERVIYLKITRQKYNSAINQSQLNNQSTHRRLSEISLFEANSVESMRPLLALPPTPTIINNQVPNNAPLEEQPSSQEQQQQQAPPPTSQEVASNNNNNNNNINSQGASPQSTQPKMNDFEMLDLSDGKKTPNENSKLI